MLGHTFIFQKGDWIGEGKIAFSASPEQIKFYTKWTIESASPSEIRCLQQVEMHGTTDQVRNHLTFMKIVEGAFEVELENDLVGKIFGKGIIDGKNIAWEYRNQEKFEGFEVYERLENGDYLMHAEYASEEQFRTIIDGRIWLKTS